MNQRYNKVVLHVHQRQSVIIGDKEVKVVLIHQRYNKVVLHVHQRQSVIIGDK